MKLSLLCVAAAALAVTACSAESTTSAPNSKYTGYTSYVIPVADLIAESPSGRAVIDLSIPDYGYWVAADIDYAAVDMICPSGRVMSLDGWTAELGVPDATRDSGVFLYSSGSLEARAANPGVEKKIPPCEEPPCTLEQETDGTWVCLCPPE